MENLVKTASKSNIELIFNIDKNLPKFLIGDFTHIGEVFSKFLEHIIVVSTHKEVILELKGEIVDSESNELDLKASLIYKSDKDIKDKDIYFMPIYNEFKEEYQRLGIYVAQELIKLMNGTVNVDFNSKNNFYQIDVTIPLAVFIKLKIRRKYRIPSKFYLHKNILIVNNKL